MNKPHRSERKSEVKPISGAVTDAVNGPDKAGWLVPSNVVTQPRDMGDVAHEISGTVTCPKP